VCQAVLSTTADSSKSSNVERGLSRNSSGHQRRATARGPLMGADVNVRCPRCGYNGLRPARPRWYDGIRLALTRSKPYRCLGCRTRRWWRSEQVSSPQ